MSYDYEFIKICQSLGKNIHKLRILQNKSLKQMSENTKINIKYLQKIESGKACGILICRHLLKISNFLNIKLSDLLDFE